MLKMSQVWKIKASYTKSELVLVLLLEFEGLGDK